jgi:hypothetical protein
MTKEERKSRKEGGKEGKEGGEEGEDTLIVATAAARHIG